MDNSASKYLNQFFLLLNRNLDNNTVEGSAAAQHTHLDALKEALLAEFDLPEVALKEDRDAYSERWHQIFERNLGKIRSVFANLGVPETKLELIWQEYGKKVHHNLWK
ncbi:MAG: hypothetical protein ACFB0B_00135 [Thermonemataceae bacterium]